MISRYDEVLSEKANKTAIFALEYKFMAKFAKKDELVETKSELEQK